MRTAFENNSSVAELSKEFGGSSWTSKQRWDKEVFDALQDLAKEADLRGPLPIFSVPLNTTEYRAVLHMALRANREDAFLVDRLDVVEAVIDIRDRMLGFVDRAGHAAAGEITDVVNIGIGGSDLGPAMAVKALGAQSRHPLPLSATWTAPMSSLFLKDSIPKDDAGDGRQNVHYARNHGKRTHRQILARGGTRNLAKQMVAVSTNLQGTKDFAFQKTKRWIRELGWGPIFHVGSSRTLHCHVVLKVADFLSGARRWMHFKNEGMDNNIPVLLALLVIKP